MYFCPHVTLFLVINVSIVAELPPVSGINSGGS